MQTLLDFLGVPLVVEFQEASEDFPASWLADCEPGALPGLMGAVAEIEIGPAVGGGVAMPGCLLLRFLEQPLLPENVIDRVRKLRLDPLAEVHCLVHETHHRTREQAAVRLVKIQLEELDLANVPDANQ